MARLTTDGEKPHAVMAQLPDKIKSAKGHMVDVKTWQQILQMNLNLRDTQAGLDEHK